MSKLLVLALIVVSGTIISGATILDSRVDNSQPVGCLSPSIAADVVLDAKTQTQVYRSVYGLPFWFKANTGPRGASEQNCYAGTITDTLTAPSTALHNKYRAGYFVFDSVIWGAASVGLGSLVFAWKGKRHA